jgi:hypothetical protein
MRNGCLEGGDTPGHGLALAPDALARYLISV